MLGPNALQLSTVTLLSVPTSAGVITSARQLFLSDTMKKLHISVQTFFWSPTILGTRLAFSALYIQFLDDVMFETHPSNTQVILLEMLQNTPLFYMLLVSKLTSVF